MEESCRQQLYSILKDYKDGKFDNNCVTNGYLDAPLSMLLEEIYILISKVKTDVRVKNISKIFNAIKEIVDDA